MNQKLIDWISRCYEDLHATLDQEEQLILRAFLTQYEIRANKLLASTQLSIQRERLNTWIQDRRRYKGPYSLNTRDEEIDILFWPWQKLHVDVTQEVVAALKSEGHIQTAYLSHNPPIQKYLRASGLSDQLEIHPESLPPNLYKENSLALKIIRASENLPELTIGKKRLRFKQVVRNAFHHWFGVYTHTREIFEQVVSKHQPKALFIGNDLTVAGSIITRLAKAEGIKTYSIMHGAIKNDLWRYSEVDQLFVFGERDKELMKSRGVSSEKLFVSGSPKVEIQKSNSTETLPAKYTKSNFHLIALSGPGHSVSLGHHRQIIDALEHLLKAFPKENFIFKLHKKDSVSYYKSIASLPNAEILEYHHPDASLSIFTWIRHTTSLITGASASALDAMALHVPVITIDCLGDLNEVAYIRENVSLHCKSTEELIERIKLILHDADALNSALAKMKKFADSSFANPKGGSIKLIMEKIQSDLRR